MSRKSMLYVDMKPLKQFAYEKLPSRSPLRNLLLSERDIIPSEEFLIKIGTWIKILKFDVEEK